MQAFIFDMDGVIIDSEPIHNKVVKEVLLENNIVVDDEEFNKLIGMTSTSVFSYFIDKHHLPSKNISLTIILNLLMASALY